MQQSEFEKLIIDQSKQLIWLVDSEFRLVYANKAYFNFMKEFTGVESKLNELAFVDAFGGSDVQQWRTYYSKALVGESFEKESHFYHPELHEIQYTQITFQPIRDVNQKIIAVSCKSRDITRIVKLRSEANQLIDASLDVLCTVNEDGVFMYVSAASINLWGYLPEELIGRSFKELILEEDLSKTDNVISGLHSGKQINAFTNRFRKKNGEIAYNLWSAKWDEKTKLRYAVARDCKEIVEREARQYRNEQRFKALVQEGSDLIGILNEDGIYTYVSPTSKSILGMLPEEFIGRSPLEFIHPDDKEKVLKSLQKIHVQKKVVVQPFRFQNGKKEWKWIETVLSNMLENPAVKGIVTNSRDVTDRINEKNKLKLFESVITNAKDSIVITEAEPQDEPGPKIMYVNEAFTKMTGYEAHEVVGKTPRILQGENSDKEELVKLGEALRKWEGYEITTINYKKNGEEFWINFNVTPVANEKGWFTHWIAVERDVTKQKQMEFQLKILNNELKKYAEDLESSNEYLEQFAFIASHDLHEPLRMITSFLDQLKRKYENQLDDKAIKYINFAVDGARRMRQIILDLLEYSRAGKLDYEMVSVDLNQILHGYKILRRKLIEEKNVIIISDKLPTVTCYIAPLTQVIHSLMDNAIKYSKKDVAPKIKVSVKEKKNEWIISVKDNGIGIDSQFFDKIFIVFQRLHNRTESEGTGIGLSIAKKNIESCNGRIWLESTLGKGSTFYFTINKIKQ